MFIHAFMQFIFAPIFGNLSDRFGRRPILLLSMSMFGINYIIMGLATSVTWLFIGKFFAGIAGGTVTTANAYMADISNEHNRALLCSLLISAMYAFAVVTVPPAIPAKNFPINNHVTDVAKPIII